MKETKKLIVRQFFNSDAIAKFINDSDGRFELVSVAVTKGLGWRYEVFYYDNKPFSEGKYSWERDNRGRNSLETEHY